MQHDKCMHDPHLKQIRQTRERHMAEARSATETVRSTGKVGLVHTRQVCPRLGWMCATDLDFRAQSEQFA